MNLDQDLAIVAEQERLLRFDAFTAEMAWRTGCHLHDAAEKLGAAMSFEVQVNGRVLFACATADAPVAQLDWIRRKRNTVVRFGRSTYALGLELERDGRTLEQRHGLSFSEYAMHGGGFPLILRGTGLVGTVIASGLHQRKDHAMVVEALVDLSGIAVPRLD